MSDPSTALLDSPQRPREREKLFAGMQRVDTSGSAKIPVLMEMVGSLSRATQPQEVLRAFSKDFRKLEGDMAYLSLSTRGLGPGQYRITRVLMDEAEWEAPVRDPWVAARDMPMHEGGFLGEVIRSAYPELIHHLSVPHDPVLGELLAPFRSMMAIPLFDQGEPLNWAISLRRDPRGFSIEDLEKAILRSNLVGGRVKSTLVARELQIAHDKIQREMQRIADIQRALLPSVMPDIPGVKLAASYETFDHAGGDYYDIQPLKRSVDGSSHDPDGPWAIIVADASGHGPAAAVIMAMLHAILHAYPHMPGGPAEVLEHVNRHLYAKRIESSFVTAFLAIYEPATRRFTYARAGHNPPLLKHPGSGGAVERLDEVGGVPLGILPDATYVDRSITLDLGQSVVFYTDGVTEALDARGRMFGLKGIEDALTECTGEPVCVMGSVMAAVREHENGVRPADDQTLLAMKVVG